MGWVQWEKSFDEMYDTLSYKRLGLLACKMLSCLMDVLWKWASCLIELINYLLHHWWARSEGIPIIIKEKELHDRSQKMIQNTFLHHTSCILCTNGMHPKPFMAPTDGLIMIKCYSIQCRKWHTHHLNILQSSIQGSGQAKFHSD